MSADVVPFPARAPIPSGMAVQAMAVGDVVLVCLNHEVCLWSAFPVATVDDDGVVTAVATRSGRVICAGRVSCDPVVYGLRAEVHEAEAFAALRWRTWTDPLEAVAAFAAIGVVR